MNEEWGNSNMVNNLNELARELRVRAVNMERDVLSMLGHEDPYVTGQADAYRRCACFIEQVLGIEEPVYF